MRSGLKFELVQLLKASNTVECLTQQQLQCEALHLFYAVKGVLYFDTLQEKERRQLSKEWNPEVTEIFLLLSSPQNTVFIVW